MVKRIDALTPAQEARFGEWVEKWTGIGLSTDPMDMATFDPAVRACYRFANLAGPKVIVRVPSPLVLALAAPIAGWLLDNRPWEAGSKKRRGIAMTRVRGAVGVAVGGAVRGAVRDAVGVAVGGAVSVAVGGAVSDAVGGAVSDTVRGAVSDAVGGAVSGAVRRYVREYWSWIIGGQLWVGGWYWGSSSWVSYFQDVCGLELPGDIGARARAYQATASSACWWWPHREFVMVSERPLSIQRDDRGRLHNESGPAIVWPDGFGVHAVHGVRVPADLIEHPEGITTKRVNDERNAEIRRVMIERYGRERFLRDSGAKMIHQDDWGKLWRTDFASGEEPLLIVEVLNSTPEPDGSFKTYMLGVDPNDPRCTTALGSIAWTFDMKPDDYRKMAAMT